MPALTRRAGLQAPLSSDLRCCSAPAAGEALARRRNTSTRRAAGSPAAGIVETDFGAEQSSCRSCRSTRTRRSARCPRRRTPPERRAPGTKWTSAAGFARRRPSAVELAADRSASPRSSPPAAGACWRRRGCRTNCAPGRRGRRARCGRHHCSGDCRTGGRCHYGHRRHGRFRAGRRGRRAPEPRAESGALLVGASVSPVAVK